MGNQKYLQLGISGIAENKEFNESLDSPIKELKRAKLAEFIRHKCELSGREFAKAVQVSPATITKWLYTETQPSLRVVKRIATVYGVSVADVDELFTVASG